MLSCLLVADMRGPAAKVQAVTSHAASSGGHDGEDEADILMLEEEELDFAGAGPTRDDAHRRAVHYVRQQGKYPGKATTTWMSSCCRC